MVDSPTAYGTDTGVGGEVRGNYATLNRLITTTTLSNGNLQCVSSYSPYGRAHSTIGVSSGKWYAEVTISTVGSGVLVGITNAPVASNATGGLGYLATEWAYFSDGRKYNGNTLASYGASYTTNDVISVALDLDNKTIAFYKNGTSQSTAYSSLADGTYFISIGGSGAILSTLNVNFGQRAFAYTAPSGFKALCTTNLPTPTIGATSTTQAGKYFDATIFTSNGTTQTVTNTGFQPDFLWFKRRDATGNHFAFNSVVGDNSYLVPNLTDAEGSAPDFISSLNSNGFTMGTAQYSNGQTVVCWNWNAGGSNATNTSGTITSTVRANTTSGFSIVTYTGTGSNATVGHGLGVAPSMVIVKRRSGADAWYVYNANLTSAAFVLQLNSTIAQTSIPSIFNSTSPSSSVFSISTDSSVNSSGQTYVAYCFAPVAGYSAFGRYTGNGSTDGPFVFLGFRPRYVMTKRTDSTSNWVIQDTSRDPYNATNNALFANLNFADNTGPWFDVLSNGFKVRNNGSDTNASGATYIYIALAESPFKYALAR
jgi:hypothetical protein